MILRVEVTAAHIERGEVGNCKTCPVAMAMIDVGIEDPIAGYGLSGTFRGRRFLVPMPDGVSDFILAYDRYEVPDPMGFDLEIPGAEEGAAL